MADIKVIKNESEFNSFVNNNGVRIVKFSANWCGPCKVMGNTLAGLEQSKLNGSQIGSVDVDDVETVAEKYNIRNIPTLIYFRNGEVVDRTTGIMNTSDFYKKVEEVSKK